MDLLLYKYNKSFIKKKIFWIFALRINKRVLHLDKKEYFLKTNSTCIDKRLNHI